nr:Retrovirus-related Pol polyprotein from transposon TNT 1-94 [Ipomoea batatas]
MAPEITDANYITWQRANNMVLSWLLHFVIPVIAQSILWLDTAKEVRDDLKERFCQEDVFRISDVQAEIYNIKQGDLSVSAYFTKFKLLWDGLLSLKPLPTCTCTPRCKCGCLDRIKEHHQMEQVTTFLRGLSENYAGVKSQIMLMTPLPMVGKACSLVQQQEHQIFHGGLGALVLANGEEVVQSAFLARTTQAGNINMGASTTQRKIGNSNKKPICSFCGFTGHTVDKCYKLHGYPPGWKGKNKQSGVHSSTHKLANLVAANSMSVTDVSCQDIPSPISQPTSHIPREQLNTPLDDKLPSTVAAGDINRRANASFTSFKPNVQDGKHFVSCQSLTWIIDTGATDHIVNNVTYFLDSNEVREIYVMLPDGNRAMVTHAGRDRKMIGLAEERDGLYRLLMPDDEPYNGPEFKMTEFYGSRGIEHQRSCVGTPQQNSVVKCKHQHILAVARALRFQACLPEEFWADCVAHAVFLINRLPSPVIKNRTPYEVLFHKTPLYTTLKVFGCLSYASTLVSGRTKFSPRARKCIFIGFQKGMKGYKLYDLHKEEVFVLRDVLFHEFIFPFAEKNKKTISEVPLPNKIVNLGENTSISVVGDTSMQTTTQLPGLVQGVVEESSMGGGISSSPDNAHFLGNFSSPGGSYSLSPECQQLGDNFGVGNSTSSYMSSNGQDDRMPYDSSSPVHDGEPTHDGEPAYSGGPMCSDDSHSQSLVQPHNAEVVPTLRCSTRHRVPPSYLKDYHCNLIYGGSSNSCI